MFAQPLSPQKLTDNAVKEPEKLPITETLSKKLEQKKSRKGILIATILFFIFILPIAIYYVTQSPQFAEIRSRATATCTPKSLTGNNAILCEGVSCTPTNCNTRCCIAGGAVTPATTPGVTPGHTPGVTQPTVGGDTKTCNTSARLGKCGPGGDYYLGAWLPNHVICGTCDRADNYNTCGTWQGEAGINKAECCGDTCGGDFPWTFENQCLSTKTSNKEVCFHVQADCDRVKPCAGVTNTPGLTSPPESPNTPTVTPLTISTVTPMITPTNGPTNSPVPGTPGKCDASCDSDSNCESGLICVTSTGIKRCRNAACPDKTDCSCPAATTTPTTYYVNNTPTNQPTPKIPIAGVGPGIFGAISVAGSILLLVVGLVL